MKRSSRPVAYGLLLFAAGATLNFCIFLLNYRILAFAHLSEEQRVANAEQILTVTLGTFAAASLVIAGLAYLFFRLLMTAPPDA